MTNKLNQSTVRMRLTKTKSAILACVVAAVMTLPFFVPAQKAQAGNEDSDRGGNPGALLGTWIIQVSIDPATVPPGSVLNFTVVSTYGAGGGFTRGGMGNGPGGVGGNPDAHGNWASTGQRHFASTASGSSYDDAHHYTMQTKVRDILTLNKRGDELTGNFQTDLFLADGTPLPFHPAGTYHGIPMPIEPLN